MSAARHLATADTIADDVGLDRARFDTIVRFLTSMVHVVEDDETGTTRVIAKATGATPDQVAYVWRAWVRSTGPAG